MIKFFHKIRQGLLTDNKFSKYLIYAIGEILLVIVGIIIALQINNWNEKRITQNRIDSRLISLISDLETEIEELNDIKDACNKRIIVIHTILKHNNRLESIGWPENLSIADSIKTILNPNSSLSIVKTFDGKRPTYDELINTGEFYTLKDKSLAKKIQEYYGAIDEQKDAERWNNMETFLKILKSKERLGVGAYSKVSIEQLAALARQDPQFGAELETEIMLDWVQKRNTIRLTEQALDLIETIRSVMSRP